MTRHLHIRTTLVAIAFAITSVSPGLAAPPPPTDGGPIFAEWPVSYKQQKLLVYAAGKFKPYVKEFYTLKGRNILRDAPYDHLHHHGLMYAIRANGVNFWEEIAGCGYEKPVATSPWTESKTPDGRPQFQLQQTIHWLAPADVDQTDTAKVALLIENRILTLTVNEDRQEVALQWLGKFEIGAKTNVVTLTGANYNGLGMRFQQTLDPLARHFNSEGAPNLTNRQDVTRHLWSAVAFDPPGQPATIALFGHPLNPRGTAWFFAMQTPFAYLAATQNLDQEPLVYRAGDQFQVNYLVTLYPEVKSPEAITARGQQWQKSSPKPVQQLRSIGL